MQTLPRAIRAKLRSRFGILLAGTAILVIVGAVIVSRTTLFADATSVRSQAFTELYFADPAALPKKVTTGRSYTADFVIANRTDTTQTYTYDVFVQTESAIVRQNPVTITVAAGTTRRQQFSFQTPIPGQRTLVTVALEGSNQVIRFYAAP